MNDTRLIDLTVQKFVEEVASDKPAPGGGSVSALGGTLATALAVLVGKATFGKEKFNDVQDEMEVVISKGTKFFESLMKLVDEDTEAFNQVLSAYRMPRDEAEARSYAIQTALKRAAEVPLKVAKTSFRALDLILTAAEKGNKNAITDVGVAALFAESAVRGALLNVKINLLSIKDEEIKDHFRQEMKEIIENVASKKETVLRIVEAELTG